LTHNKISAGISIDYYEAGRILAQKMTETTDPATPVYLLSEARTDRVNTRMYDGILSVLQERGYVSRMLKFNSPDQYHRIAKELVDQEHQEAIVMALDLESLTRMAEILDENPIYREGIRGFYGMGTTLETLNYLDEGIIDGMIVANDFIQGYLSVEKAVEAIQNTGTHETIQTEYFYINKENIRKKEYQKLLYPID
ncbi:MAG: substrate-binding domain-containing protein, partial [Hungatella sp.]